MNGTILAYCPILCENFSKPFLKDLTQVFKESTILPDEYIVQETESCYVERNLFFVSEGTVSVVMEKTGQIIVQLEVKL